MSMFCRSRLWQRGAAVRQRLCSLHSIEGAQRNGIRQHAPSLVQMKTYCSSAPIMTKTVPIIYMEADGTEKEVQAEIAKNLLEVAHENNVELEGACGGELACSTCHLVFPKDIYDTLPEKEEDEEDMLDLAFEVTETSRLGCQIIVREDFAGMQVKIPDDGF